MAPTLIVGFDIILLEMPTHMRNARAIRRRLINIDVNSSFNSNSKTPTAARNTHVVCSRWTRQTHQHWSQVYHMLSTCRLCHHCLISSASLEKCNVHSSDPLALRTNTDGAEHHTTELALSCRVTALHRARQNLPPSVGEWRATSCPLHTHQSLSSCPS